MTLHGKADKARVARVAAAAALRLACCFHAAESFSSFSLPIGIARFESAAPVARGRLGALPPSSESRDAALSAEASAPPFGGARDVRRVEAEELVPSTWNQALRRFFVGDAGPPLVVASIIGFLHARSQLPIPFSAAEALVVVSTIVFWWVQEYALHRALLHSPFDWTGKAIHRAHHERDYFHVSIDPPGLLLGWLLAAHLALRCALPAHLCLSATAAYALAGLWYEWSHYIVHTRVRPPSASPPRSSPASGDRSPRALRAATSLFSRSFLKMRDNHMRHHLVDDRYWYAFSVPAMDDLFDTNPSVRDVRRPDTGTAVAKGKDRLP